MLIHFPTTASSPCWHCVSDFILCSCYNCWGHRKMLSYYGMTILNNLLCYLLLIIHLCLKYFRSCPLYPKFSHEVSPWWLNTLCWYHLRGYRLNFSNFHFPNHTCLGRTCKQMRDVRYCVLWAPLHSMLTWVVLMQRRWGSLKSMVQCVGHKRSNVSQIEGLSVPQRHAAVGPGHPSMHSAPYAVRPPSTAKTLEAVNFFKKDCTSNTSATAMQCRIYLWKMCATHTLESYWLVSWSPVLVNSAHSFQKSSKTTYNSDI